MSKNQIFATLVLVLLSISLRAQEPSAHIQFDSQDKGILIPRMSSPQIAAISNPADGLMVYDSSLHVLFFYNVSQWQKISIVSLDMNNNLVAGSDTTRTGTNNTVYGFEAGQYNIAGDGNVSVGYQAGKNSSSDAAVAVGTSSGETSQGDYAVAVGDGAGQASQGYAAVAVGNGAGNDTQGANAAAVGLFAGHVSQGQDAVAVGYEAGFDTQGANAVAVGNSAGHTNQMANSIAINASGVALNPTNSGFYVDPIRQESTIVTPPLVYNPTTKEITYGTASPFYLGQDTLEGIVFYIYKGSDGQQHGLIVSKTETTAQWQSTSSLTSSNRTWDGDYNTDLMTNSPAKDSITTNFTMEWYLPSVDELSLLWHNRFHVNKSLETGGHTLLLYAAYWASLEWNESSAWKFFFNEGALTNFVYSKTDTNNVRAIRAF